MSLLTIGLFALAVQAQAVPAQALRDITLENGSVVRVEAGELQVPESRRRPTARRLTIPYYRLRSTAPATAARKPASPIFLLAGGPGSSWLDQFRNEEYHRELEYYRTIADVVLFDQRGAGHARPSMTCPQTAQLPVDQPLDAAMLREVMRPLLIACRDHWLSQGVDLAAYNTIENAADVDDLRIALGYDKINLIGGSYGSHLALQYMRQFPKAVDRVVIYGVEGPGHTWDNPAGALATLARIAAEAERSPELAPHIPRGGLLKTLERVIARLEQAPQTITIDETRVVVDANVARRMARRAAGRRKQPNAWPEMILTLDRGDYSLLAKGRLENRRVRLADPMHYSMDCASGISEKRRQRYRQDPATSLLGDINFEYEALCDVWPSEDLGDAFRRNVKSDIPTLIVHGTLDTSTPIENAREVAASLRNAHLVEVAGGTHGALYNLYERWPPMHEMLAAFLSGKKARFPRTIVDPREVKFRPLEAAWNR